MGSRLKLELLHPEDWTEPWGENVAPSTWYSIADFVCASITRNCSDQRSQRSQGDGRLMYLGDAHLVCSQCTCLVGAYHIRAPESFDARQVSDDGIFLSHLLGAKSQTSGNDSSETFGNGSHCQRDSDLEVVDCASQCTTMGGVPKVTEIDEPNQNTYNRYHFGQQVTKIVELTLQRRFLAYLLRYRVVNVTNRGFSAGESNNSTRGSVYDGGSLREG